MARYVDFSCSHCGMARSEDLRKAMSNPFTVLQKPIVAAADTTRGPAMVPWTYQDERASLPEVVVRVRWSPQHQQGSSRSRTIYA